jgi:hypothetical protein
MTGGLIPQHEMLGQLEMHILLEVAACVRSSDLCLRPRSLHEPGQCSRALNILCHSHLAERRAEKSK